jgi:serine/threonine-protein kinase
VEARRLRSKLKEYYEGDGRNDAVVISFEPGRYVPAFRGPPVATAAEPTLRAVALGASDQRTVAVLPFANLTPEPDQEFFCDGITEELIHALAKIPELTVLGRTTTFSLKGVATDPRELAARLGAGTLVEGSVRKAGNLVRVAVQLINGRTGGTLWSDRFDTVIDDVPEIEYEIAGAIADQLRVRVGRPVPRPPNRNAEAHLLYLRGRHSWRQSTRDGFHEAVEHFTRGMSLFPNEAPCYAGLADALLWLAMWGMERPHDVLPRSRRVGLEALRIDPSCAEAAATVGAVRCFYDWEWSEGLLLLERAVEQEPGYVLGYNLLTACLLPLAKFEKAMKCAERAVRLDPLSIRANSSIGWVCYRMRRYDEAEHWYRTASELDPKAREPHYYLARLYLARGNYADALLHARQSLRPEPDGLTMGQLGAAFARSGDQDQARVILADMSRLAAETYIDPLGLVYLYAGLNDVDSALDWLRTSCEARSPMATLAATDPLFDNLRNDARFGALISGMGLA